MDATTFSAIAAAISAACALFTIYMFREQGKGFVWTKDHKLTFLTNQNGDVHMEVEIPLFNFGKGNIRFLKLRAKKINLKTKAMENFELDMDEAYFPEGVSIIVYRTAIQTFLDSGKTGQFILTSNQIPTDLSAMKDYQERINKEVGEIPEHIVILKCKYKDGSWFGTRNKETVIGLSIIGFGISYLSTFRRKELHEYFAW
jgi:hypothetical protein